MALTKAVIVDRMTDERGLLTSPPPSGYSPNTYLINPHPLILFDIVLVLLARTFFNSNDNACWQLRLFLGFTQWIAEVHYIDVNLSYIHPITLCKFNVSFLVTI